MEGELKERGPMNAPIYKDDIVARLLGRGKHHYARDAQNDKFYLHPWGAGEEVPARDGYPARKRFPIREGISSSAGLVLKADRQKLGVMFVSFRTRHSFGQDERIRIELFAQQAALAIRNARLVTNLSKQNKNLNVLSDVGRALTAGIRVEEPQILELIQRQASRLMPMDNMYIALYDEGTDTVRFGLAMQQGRRLPDEYFQPGSTSGWAPRSGGQGRTEEIIHTRKPIFHKTKTEAEAWYAQAGRKEYLGQTFASWIGVPMMVGEKVLGVLAAYHPTLDYAYDETTFQVLTTLVSQAAIALDNARLYYRVNRSLGALNEVGRALTSGIRLEEPQILELIQRQASRLMPMDNMYIALYDEGTDTVRFGLAMQHGRRLPDEYFQPGSTSGWAPRSGGQGRTEEIIHTRKPIFHKTKTEAEAWYAQAGRKEYLGQVSHSWIGVPMIVGEKVLGVLAAYHPTLDYAYDETDLQVLTTLASQAAIALDNARLYGSEVSLSGGLAHQVEELNVVREITNAIPTHAELPAFLQAILDLSLPHLGAKGGTIQLVDKPTNNLVVEARTGTMTEKKFTRIPLSQGITGQAARERRLIYVPDVRESPDYLPYLNGTLSEMVAPLIVGDDLLGVFNLEDPKVDAFDRNRRELFALIVEEAAIAIQQKKRLMEEQAKRIEAEKDALLGRFTQDIAHYVKNQVGIIRLAAINLLTDPEVAGAPTRQKELERIKRNAEITIKLAQDLFEPYKQAEKEWVNVNWLVDEALDLVGEQKDIETHLDLALELPQVYIERQGAVRVFQELLINAHRAVRRGKEPRWVHVSSRRSAGGDIELVFSNSGPPIPHERWEAIFQQFSGGVEDVGGREGFGLGLWQSRVFLRRQSGDIRVLESNPTQTTFVVRLPVPSPVEKEG
jgi:GAF domain-containing protein